MAQVKVKAAPAVDFFATAKPVPPKAALPKAGKTRIEIEGLDEYAALDVVEKTVKALKEGAREALQQQSNAVFLDYAERAKKRPDSFRGFDKNAEASVELRRKAVNQPLSDEAVAILTEENLPVEEIADKDETFIVNPDRLAWLTENASKVSAALAKIGAPIDLFQKQEATVKRVVSEATLDELFKRDRETMEKVLPLVTNFAIKPTTNEDPQKALARVLVTTAGISEDQDALVDIIDKTLVGARSNLKDLMAALIGSGGK